jgi:hypothetical protein
VSESVRSPLTGSVRTLAAWWRSRGDLLQDSVLAAAFMAAAFAPPLAANGLTLGA